VKLLVLGGTQFVGRHVVRAALERGHQVTTFTRGRTNPDLFPEVEAIRGDRDGDHGALRAGTWDAVVDTSAYKPRQAAAAADALKGWVGRYCLISTASVYAAFPDHGATEDAATHAPPDDPEAAVRPETYGPLKVGCERAIVESFGDEALVLRPGVLVGPHDPTGRLGYWVERVAAGGEALAPGDPAHPVQLLDARDLAAWLLALLERGSADVFNASGPATPLTMGGLLESCRLAAGSDARFTWADDAFLLGRGIRPWVDLPLWLPKGVPGPLLDDRKARAAGLRPRPFIDTVRDILADDALPERAPGGPPRPATLGRDRERELLRALRGHSGPAETR